jgi:hypothetical protein
MVRRLLLMTNEEVSDVPDEKDSPAHRFFEPIRLRG